MTDVTSECLHLFNGDMAFTLFLLDNNFNESLCLLDSDRMLTSVAHFQLPGQKQTTTTTKFCLLLVSTDHTGTDNSGDGSLSKINIHSIHHLIKLTLSIDHRMFRVKLV